MCIFNRWLNIGCASEMKISQLILYFSRLALYLSFGIVAHRAVLGADILESV